MPQPLFSSITPGNSEPPPVEPPVPGIVVFGLHGTVFRSLVVAERLVQ